MKAGVELSSLETKWKESSEGIPINSKSSETRVLKGTPNACVHTTRTSTPALFQNLEWDFFLQ